MDSNKKIILSFGVLFLMAVLGLWVIWGFEKPFKDLPGSSPLAASDSPASSSLTSVLPETSAKPIGSVNAVDDAINSFVADAQFESSVFEEEFVSLNQTVLLETQAVNDFGQIYNQNEL